jgi:hypothetical protein
MFNVYEFCCFNLLHKTCTAFLFNEAVLKFAKLGTGHNLAGGMGRCNSKFEGMIFCHPALP